MVLSLILIFLLFVSCTAPTSYQIIRYMWPQLPVMWRLLASFVVMILCGFIAYYWIIPALFPLRDVPTMQFGSTPPGVIASRVLVCALVVLALISTGLTISQLFRRNLSSSALAWRIPLAIGLGMYFVVLAMLIFAAIWG